MYPVFMKSCSVIVMAIGLLAVGGCTDLVKNSHAESGFISIDSGALSKGKTYAIVSTVYSADIPVDAQAAAGSVGNADDVRALATKLEMPIFRAIQAANAIKFIPTSKVVANSTYKEVKGDPFSGDRWLANFGGIKYFNKPEKFAQIASALKADGVIALHIRFSSPENFITCAAKFYARTTVVVEAYDKQGKAIWNSQFAESSIEGVKRFACLGAYGLDTKALMNEIDPLFIESTNAAVKKVAERINSTAK